MEEMDGFAEAPFAATQLGADVLVSSPYSTQKNQVMLPVEAYVVLAPGAGLVNVGPIGEVAGFLTGGLGCRIRTYRTAEISEATIDTKRVMI
jgi:hypothetical protein